MNDVLPHVTLRRGKALLRRGQEGALRAALPACGGTRLRQHSLAHSGVHISQGASSKPENTL